MALADIPGVVEDFGRGRFVVLVDEAGPTPLGHLAVAAEHVTAETINFLARFGRGLICIAMTAERLDELDLPLMVNEPPAGGAGASFTVSVEARRGTTTGISAHDRAQTILTLIDPATRPEDLARPGHMFPIRTRSGGVLVRPAAPEASVDVARLAGIYPAVVICAIMNEDGSLATAADLTAFAETHEVKLLSIADLVAHRLRTDKFVYRVIPTSVRMPTKYGHFQAVPYRTNLDTAEHVALIKGDLTDEEPVLAGVHVQCLAGDVFGSPQCDCEAEIGPVLRRIEGAGRGVLLYLCRPADLPDSIYAGAAPPAADPHTAEIDPQEFAVAARILDDLGVHAVRLLTDNPQKPALLNQYGISVVEVLPTGAVGSLALPSETETKREHLADLLGIDRLTGL